MNKINYTVDELIQMFDSMFVSNIVYKTDEGYIFFNKYRISKQGDMFVARRYTDDVIKTFSKLRYAASWCILDKYNKIPEAKRLSELSIMLDSVEAEIIVHSRLQKFGSVEIREINKGKWLAATDKQKRFQWELDKYIKLAKTYQDKGYQNELTRATRNKKN